MKVKVTLKRILLCLLALMGYALWAFGGKRRRGAAVLLYHSLAPRNDHEINVTPEELRKHLAFVKRRHTLASAAEIVRMLKDGRDLSSCVAITLDDGYASVAEHGLKIITELDVPATVFIPVGLVETGVSPEFAGEAPEGLVSWGSATKLARAGLTLGVHGWSHTRLSRLSESQLPRETSHAKELLERRTGRRSALFSYPYGKPADYDGRTVRSVIDAGFDGAFTARYGFVERGADPFQLPRIGIEASDNLLTIRAKLNGALSILALKESKPGRWLARSVNRLLGI